MAKGQSVSLGYGRGRVEELPSGSWRWQGTVDGERTSITRPTQHEAIAAAGAALTTQGHRIAGIVTVAEAAEAWRLIAVVGKRGKTVQGYAWALDVIVDEIGRLKVADLTRAQLRGVIAGWTKRYTSGSIAKLRSVLGRLLDYCVDAEWLPASPMPPRTDGTPKPAPKRPKHLTPADMAVVRQHCVAEHSTTHALALTMLLTGMRPGEARAVQWDAVDLDEARVYVRRSIQADDDDVDHLVDDVKTSRYGDEGKRTIPLPPDLVAVLRRERAAQHARGMITPFVFAGDDGAFLTRDVVAGIPAEIARATDTRLITPYGYRHTYLSMLADSLLPIATQRRLAGHREHSNVIARYTHDMRGDDVDTTPYLGAVVELPGASS